MSDAEQKAYGLIRSLLSLGDISRNSSVHEVESALAKAAYLIDKYSQRASFQPLYDKLEQKLADHKAGKTTSKTDYGEHGSSSRRGGFEGFEEMFRSTHEPDSVRRYKEWYARHQSGQAGSTRQEDARRQQQSGGQKTHTRAKRHHGKTIRSIVFEMFDKSAYVSYEEVARVVKAVWPESAFNRAHYKWYRAKWQSEKEQDG